MKEGVIKMKKKNFLIAGILVGLVLAFGIFLAACDDGAGPDDADYKKSIDTPYYGVHGSGTQILTPGSGGPHGSGPHGSGPHGSGPHGSAPRAGFDINAVGAIVEFGN